MIATRGRGEERFAWLLIAPTVLLLLGTQAYPIIEGFRLSFTDTSLVRPRAGEYVGLKNYAQLFDDPRFGKIVWVTGLYTVASVLGSLALGMLSALAMNLSGRGRSVVRSMLTVPWAVPGVATALVAVWMLDAQFGIVNRALAATPLLEEYQRWLHDPDLALPAVVAVTIWKVFPFAALALLAAMQAIPSEILEAARIDGAGTLNRFRQIVLPALTPTLLTLALFMTIWSLRRFELIWLLTGGGPVDATNTLTIDLYRESFRNRRLGYGAAIGVIGLALAVATSAFYLGLARHYQKKHGR